MGSILIIYTGGTIGMFQDEKTGALRSFNFDLLLKEIPEIKKFKLNIQTISFEEPVDSSNLQPEDWLTIAGLIYDNYSDYDGFVVLHGSDTMAYTASALSFMLENLSKSVILTGSQLPIGAIRTDARENLLSSIEIASMRNGEQSLVPEVAIYFEYNLYRGNRSTKISAEEFEAFKSPNYPLLGEAGVNLKFNKPFIRKSNEQHLILNNYLNNNIASIKLYPGITEKILRAVLSTTGLRALVLETFGAGNATTQPWFINTLKEFIDKNVIVLNITQCIGGQVEQGKYETSQAFNNIGVVSGKDMTYEAALTKMMYLLGTNLSTEEIKVMLQKSLRGEITE